MDRRCRLALVLLTVDSVFFVDSLSDFSKLVVLCYVSWDKTDCLNLFNSGHPSWTSFHVEISPVLNVLFLRVPWHLRCGGWLVLIRHQLFIAVKMLITTTIRAWIFVAVLWNKLAYGALVWALNLALVLLMRPTKSVACKWLVVNDWRCWLHICITVTRDWHCLTLIPVKF